MKLPSFRGLSAILFKEFIAILRDPMTLFFMLFPPLIEMIAFGYALDNDVKHMAMVVLNEDRTVESRQFGTTKWSFRRLFRFAFDGITSFSTVPLRVWTYLGGVISLLSIAIAIYFVLRTLFFGTDVPGYPSLIVSLTFFSGVQLMSLGMIGEYVGRIFAEVKRRPLYVVAEAIGGPAQRLPAFRDERRAVR